MVDLSDFDYMKEKGYKATSLLRSKIQELKSREFGELVELQQTIKRLNDLKKRYIAFINSEGLMSKFIDFKEDDNDAIKD